MTIILKAITAVFHQGRIIKPGENFSCQSDYAKKLVANKSASFLHVNKLENTMNGEENNENGSTTNEADQLIAENGEENNENGEINNEPTGEELTAIFDKMERDELIAIAEKNNVELKARTPKPDIITKLVEAGVMPNEKDV